MARSSMFVGGVTLFINEMPETDQAALVMAAYPGSVEDTYGGGLPAVEKTAMTVVSRSTAPSFGLVPSSTSAERLIHTAYQKLTTLVEVTSTSPSARRFHAVLPDSGPYYAGQDEQARLLFQQEWSVVHRPTTSD